MAPPSDRPAGAQPAAHPQRPPYRLPPAIPGWRAAFLLRPDRGVAPDWVELTAEDDMLTIKVEGPVPPQSEASSRSSRSASSGGSAARRSSAGTSVPGISGRSRPPA